jgi:hypothetical protein
MALMMSQQVSVCFFLAAAYARQGCSERGARRCILSIVHAATQSESRIARLGHVPFFVSASCSGPAILLLLSKPSSLNVAP